MNTRKLLALIMVITLVVTLFTGCSGSKDTQGSGAAQVDQKEKAITFNIGGDPSTMDPAKVSTTNEIAAAVQLEGLTRMNPESKLVPGIAESWDISPDGLVYTFKLRDAKFSNGDPITANDFVYSWSRVLDPRSESPYSYIMCYIKNGNELSSVDMSAADAEAKIEEAKKNLGIEAVDEKTLKITLVSPAPYFLGLTAFPTYYPVNKNLVEKNAEWADSAANYVSDGPFKLLAWEHGQKLSLVKNDQYWDADSVKLDKIDLLIVEQGSTEVTMWETGQLDVTWGWNIPISEVKRLDKEGKVGYIDQIQNRYIMINSKKAPLDDPKVRKALSLAMDRKLIAENIIQSAVPLYSYVPEGMSDEDPSQDFRLVGGDLIKESVEEAKKLLAEAGYPDAKGFPGFEIVYTTDEKTKAMVEATAEMWSKNLNINNITIKNVEGKIRSQLRKSGDFNLTWHGWSGDYLDPLTFLEVFLSDSGQNNGKWANAEYDRLVKLAQSSDDSKVRYESMHKAEQILIDDTACIPFSNEKVPYMQNPKLKDVVRTALGQTDFKWAYLED